MDKYDFFVASLALVSGGILGLAILFDLYEELKNGK